MIKERKMKFFMCLVAALLFLQGLSAQVSFNPTIIIKNGLDKKLFITRAYIFPSDAKGNVPDLIKTRGKGKIVYLNNAQFTMNVSTDDEYIYTIVVFDNKGSRYMQKDVDVSLKGITLVTITAKDKVGGAAAPAASASGAQAPAQTLTAPASNPPAATSAAPSGEPSTVQKVASKVAGSLIAGFLSDKPDLVSEAGQAAAFKALELYLDKSFTTTVTMGTIKAVPTKNASGGYDIVIPWTYKEPQNVINNMAAFYQLIADVSNNQSYIDAIQKSTTSGNVPVGTFVYHPNSYSDVDQKISFKYFPSAKNLLGCQAGNGGYIIFDFNTALMDKANTPITEWHRSLDVRPPYGGAKTQKGTFTGHISDEAYRNMGAVKVTSVTLK
jgi:hypothetical protein